MMRVLRWPGMFAVDVLAARGGMCATPPDSQRVWRELDRNVDWYGPRRLVWLYRWLPIRVSWHGRRYEAAWPAYFLWSIYAHRWSFAWLPRRRARVPGAWLGVFRYGDYGRVVL